MKKSIISFLKSILVIAILIGISFLAGVIIPKLYPLNTEQIQILYALLELAIFGPWYYFVFYRSWAHLKRQHKKKLHIARAVLTPLSIVIIVFSMYYACIFVVSITATANPQWLSDYVSLLSESGLTSGGVLITIDAVLLAPVAEEIIFRGLVYRYSKKLLPFLLACVWQALCFGFMHGNMIQGIYAFIVGVVLCFLVYIGQSLRFSITAHIIFNAIGLFAAAYLPTNMILFLISFPVLVFGIFFFRHVRRKLR